MVVDITRVAKVVDDLANTAFNLKREGFPVWVVNEVGSRTNWTCQSPLCRRSREGGWLMHMHHQFVPLGVIPFKLLRKLLEPLLNRPWNCRCLCVRCHLRAHKYLALFGITPGAVSLLEATLRETDGGRRTKS